MRKGRWERSENCWGVVEGGLEGEGLRGAYSEEIEVVEK
jgi:hypothetical protein